MSAIVGVYCLDGNPDASAKLPAMLAALAHRGPDGSCLWSAGTVALGHLALHSVPQSEQAAQPLALDGGNIVVTADARIDNRTELIAQLCPGRRAASDTELIALSYRRWGAECAARLIGDFAFAIWDRSEQTVFCARDPMGVRPLYYVHTERLFALATEIKALFTLGEVPRALDEEEVALFLMVNQEDRTRTLYRHVQRLPAASTLQVSRRELRVTRYWDPSNVKASQFSSEAECVEAFRALFAESVRARLRSCAPVGATLSGGLDSSSIVCMARQLGSGQGAAPLHTFSLIFPDLGERERRTIDERMYMDHVIRGGGVQPHFIRGDQLSPLTDMERVIWHLDEPHFAPNLYLHWGMFAAARASGVRVFLDGFDGDSTVSHGLGRLNGLLHSGDWPTYEAEVHAFAHNRGIEPAAVVEHFGMPYLTALARDGHWLRWSKEAARMHRRFDYSRAQLVMQAAQLFVPASLSRAWRRLRRQDVAGEVVLRPALARQVADRLIQTQRRRLAMSAAGEQQSHLASISQPLYQLTLELADRSAAAFGLELRYPFFDRRLIEFCQGVPEKFKFARGWTRLLLRQAMEGILPPEIQWRSAKANLAPNFHAQLRGVDRAMVESTNLDRLGQFASVPHLQAARQRYFAAMGSEVREADALLLFRATVLSAWLAQVQGGSRQANLSAPLAA